MFTKQSFFGPNITVCFMFEYRYLLCLTPPSSPSVSQLGMLIRKPRCFVTNSKCKLCAKTLTPASAPNHQKNAGLPPVAVPSRHFRSAWETCTALSRKLHYGNNKPFHTFLVCVYVCVWWSVWKSKSNFEWGSISTLWTGRSIQSPRYWKEVSLQWRHKNFSS